MPATKENVAADFITLSIEDQVWVAVEVGEDYIDNQSIADQREITERLAVDGFDVAPFCRKKKTSPTH